MGQEPDWALIDKCSVWKFLGVGECDGCPSCVKCWGSNIELPEPAKEGTNSLEELLGGNG